MKKNAFFLILFLCIINSTNCTLSHSEAIKNIVLENKRIHDCVAADRFCVTDLFSVTDLKKVDKEDFEYLIKEYGFDKEQERIFKIGDFLCSYKLLKLHKDILNKDLMKDFYLAINKILLRLKDSNLWDIENEKPIKLSEEEDIFNQKFYEKMGKQGAYKADTQKTIFKTLLWRAEICLEKIKNLEKTKKNLDAMDELSDDLGALSNYFLYAEKIYFLAKTPLYVFGDTESTGIIESLFRIKNSGNYNTIFLGDYGDRWSNDIADSRALTDIRLQKSKNCITLKGNHEANSYSDQNCQYNVYDNWYLYAYLNPLIDIVIAEKFLYFRRLLTALFPVEAFHKETETFFMHGIKDPLFLHKGLVDDTKTISPMIPFVEIKGELVLDIRAMKKLRLLPKYFQDAYANKTFPSLWCDLSQYDHMTRQRGLQLSKNTLEKFLQDSYPNNNIHIIRAHQHNEETMPEIIDKTVKGEEAYLNKCSLVATAPAAMPWTGNRWQTFIQNKNLHPYLLHIAYYNDNHKNCENKSEDCCENKWTAVQIYSDKEMNNVQVKSKKK